MRNVRTLSILTVSGVLALGAVGIAGATTGSDHAGPKAAAAHARNSARHQHGHAFGHAVHDPTTTPTTSPETTTTSVAAVPDAVHEAFGIVSTDGSSIQLMWENEDHGSAEGITGFVVQFSTDGGATWTQAPDPGLVNAMTLPYAAGELFEIAAVNATGTGAFSPFSIGSTSDDDQGTSDDHGQGASEEGDQNSQGDEDDASGPASVPGNFEFGSHQGGSHHED